MARETTNSGDFGIGGSGGGSSESETTIKTKITYDDGKVYEGDYYGKKNNKEQ